MSHSRITNAGSQWRKWDLHVHTPASIDHQYTAAPGADPWDRFLTELASLPPEFGVIGINDYWFVDGYKRVNEEHRQGRLPNLETIIPVLELRLDQFGGSGSHLSRANLHVLFDPELDAAVIEQQFIAAMSSKFRLLPGHLPQGDWAGVVTRESLADLGRRIKASVPKEELPRFGSDDKEGFNNLVVSLESVQEVLGSHYFHLKHLVALGKTEWAEIRWTDGTIASKKHLVNSADLLFTAFDDASTWRTQTRKLRASQVQHRLLDCSDAHTWADAGPNKDRIGNCATWINATPSFAGLRHALSEYDTRVYVGNEPPAAARRRSAPEQIIAEVSVRPSDPSKSQLFNYTLPLNQGLVAIVGNKGQGKSALIDCIARGGNSDREADFAFLSKTRFLSPKNGNASNFQVTITWANSSSRSTPLHHAHDPGQPESLEYLPQALIERICTSDPQSSQREAFEAELRRVLFHHIEPIERQGQANLEDLMALRTKGTDRELDDARERLAQLAVAYVELCDRANQLRSEDLTSRIGAVSDAIAAAQVDLSTASARLDALGMEPETSPELQQQRADLAALDDRLEQLGRMNDVDVSAAAEATRGLTELDALISEVTLLGSKAIELDQSLAALMPSDAATRLVELRVRNDLLNARREALLGERQRLARAIENRQPEIDDVTVRRDQAQDRLGRIDTERDAARREVEQLRSRVAALIGSPTEEGSLRGLESLLTTADKLPDDLQQARVTLADTARQIHSLLTRRLDVMQVLYEPAARFIATNDLAREASLEFVAELIPAQGWDRIGDRLDARKNADLLSYLEARRVELDVRDADAVVETVAAVLKAVSNDRGATEGSGRNLRSAFRSNADPVSYLGDLVGLTWISTQFSLRGHGLPLDQLSPGERGLILLLFYLVIDRSQVPLLLDQPEENLDNAAVRRVLVEALKQARDRRQVIVVTHNANLAVVGDADQIVHCRNEGGRFLLTSGTLADLDVGEESINVLEGARPAFENRQSKYEKVVPRT